MSSSRKVTRLLSTTLPATALLGLSVTAANAQPQPQQPQKPAATQPAQPQAADDPMRNADKDMQAVLGKLKELGAKPIGTQSVEDTRKGPTPADAVKALMKEKGMDPDKVMAQLKISKKDATYPAGGGTQPLRIYTPSGTAPQGGFPVIVYYHGGGWVIADIDTYEASIMGLASKANAMVVAIEYRHAPEHKFPAAHDDAFNAYKHVLANAKEWGGDPLRLAVAGESAGGNLAINVAIMARDQNVQAPVHMLLVYPVASTTMDTPSYKETENAMPLNRQAMEWFAKTIVAKPEDAKDTRLNIVNGANLKNLPDATIITAQIDPLRSEGQDLANKLKAAGVEVAYRNYEGVVHEFFGMDAVVADAKRAQEFAAERLKADLAKPAGERNKK